MPEKKDTLIINKTHIQTILMWLKYILSLTPLLVIVWIGIYILTQKAYGWGIFFTFIGLISFFGSARFIVKYLTKETIFAKDKIVLKRFFNQDDIVLPIKELSVISLNKEPVGYAIFYFDLEQKLNTYHMVIKEKHLNFPIQDLFNYIYENYSHVEIKDLCDG